MSDRDQEVRGGLERSIQRLREEGTDHSELSTSLLIQLLSDLGITNERLVNAERQRIDLTRKLDRVMEKQENLTGVLDRLQGLEADNRLNNQFRQQFVGASMLGKAFWLVFGGIIVWVIQHFPFGRH